MADHDLDAELSLALEVADAVDRLTLPVFDRRQFEVERKADRSEVTVADREAETVAGDLLLAARPDHAVFGEEHGERGDATRGYRWVVDPIDGTSGFVRGIPIWATLLALTHADDGVLVGVVSAPALGRRWWAGRGLGAHADGRRCRVSEVARLDDAQVSIINSRGWHELGLADRLVELERRAWRSRGLGDFWQHALVAEGAVDLAIDAVGVQPYDLAAVRLLVEEAGGRFTDRVGEVTHEHDTAVSSNGLLHDEVIETLTRRVDRTAPPSP